MNKQILPETEPQNLENRAAYLEAENAQLRAENTALAERLKELEGQLAQVSSRRPKKLDVTGVSDFLRSLQVKYW